MSLFEKLREQQLRKPATATTATFATHEPVIAHNESSNEPSVATVATVAVAKQPNQMALPQEVNDGFELDRHLLEAAMRACDFWGDGQVARAEMFADVKATPHHLRKDLLEHFLSTYVDADTHLVKSAPAATSFTVLLQRCDGFKPAINFAKL